MWKNATVFVVQNLDYDVDLVGGQPFELGFSVHFVDQKSTGTAVEVYLGEVGPIKTTSTPTTKTTTKTTAKTTIKTTTAKPTTTTPDLTTTTEPGKYIQHV